MSTQTTREQVQRGRSWGEGGSGVGNSDGVEGDEGKGEGKKRAGAPSGWGSFSFTLNFSVLIPSSFFWQLLSMFALRTSVEDVMEALYLFHEPLQ